ncbi:MAG: DUF3341 domain-containing protein [Acidobacteriota bacterium]
MAKSALQEAKEAVYDLHGATLIKEQLELGEESGRANFGLLAEFDTPAAIYKACEQVRDAGYERWDSYTPFPVHGLDKAMGVRASLVPWVSLVLGLSGSGLALAFQSWSHGGFDDPSKLPMLLRPGARLVKGLLETDLATKLGLANWEYPLIISGKPIWAWPAYVPITFELGVLFGALGAVFGMLILNRLPRWYHSLFHSERFERVTDDKFFIAIESVDPKYDEQETRAFLESLGAEHVELVER